LNVFGNSTTDFSETNIRPCCALGEVTKEQAQALKEAGVTRYNHNLRHLRAFPNCHNSYLARSRCCSENLKAAGIQARTGGIIDWVKAGKIE